MTIRTINVNGRSFRVHEDSRVLDWLQGIQGKWGTRTLKIMDRFIRPDSIYVDLGACEGMSSLYGACTAARTVAVEADPVAFRDMCENVALNPHLDIQGYQVAVSNVDGMADLYNFGDLGNGRSSIFGRSDVTEYSNAGFGVPAYTLERVMEIGLVPGRPIFIKSNIEGAEFKVFPAAAVWLERWRPTLLLSLHGHFLEDHRAGIKNLMDILMNFYRHVYNHDGKLMPPRFWEADRKQYDLVVTRETW